MVAPEVSAIDQLPPRDGCKKFVPTRPEGKFNVDLAHQTTNAKIPRNMETGVRNGSSGGAESSTSHQQRTGTQATAESARSTSDSAQAQPFSP